MRDVVAFKPSIAERNSALGPSIIAAFPRMIQAAGLLSVTSLRLLSTGWICVYHVRIASSTALGPACTLWVTVSTTLETDEQGRGWMHLEIEDNGSGFSAEATEKVAEPFYTTRNVGLGLGLTVSRKIIETHHGRLMIRPSATGSPGVPSGRRCVQTSLQAWQLQRLVY